MTPEAKIKFAIWIVYEILTSASAQTSGSYTLQSAIQKLHGPRLYHPFFGFAYRGSNSEINVTINKDNTYINLLTVRQDSPFDWKYISKNLTSFIYNWIEGQEFRVNSKANFL